MKNKINFDTIVLYAVIIIFVLVTIYIRCNKDNNNLIDYEVVYVD